jgi:hypothetical protein
MQLVCQIETIEISIGSNRIVQGFNCIPIKSAKPSFPARGAMRSSVSRLRTTSQIRQATNECATSQLTSCSYSSRLRLKMGGCCCCFPVRKPPRENPMHPGHEPLIWPGPNSTAHHHPPPMIAYSEVSPAIPAILLVRRHCVVRLVWCRFMTAAVDANSCRGCAPSID